MSREAGKKILKEQGISGFVLHYGARVLTKVEKQVIGRGTAYLCKVKKNRLVFKNRENLDFTDNPRAFFDYLLKMGYNDRYEMIWLVSDPGKFRHLNYKNVKFVTAENRYGWNSCRAYYYAATARYFFFSHNTQDLLDYGCQGRQIINLWHGCGYKGPEQGMKTEGGQKARSDFDYGLVPGPLFVQTKSVAWNCEKEKIWPIGYPRYDWMLHPSLGKYEMLKKIFGWEGPKSKAVIWMPTFRKSNLKGCRESEIQMEYQLPGLTGEDDLRKLDMHLKKLDMLLIIKKHPLQTEWSQNENELTNIRYVTEEMLENAGIQLAELMGICDGLISDYSSAAVDFMLLHRPMAYVLEDFMAYKEKRGFVFEDPLIYMPGEKVYDYQGIEAFLEHVAAGEDLYKEEREKLMPVMHNPAKNYCRRLQEWLKL